MTRRSPGMPYGQEAGGYGGRGGGGGKTIKANPAVRARQTAAKQLAEAKRTLKLEKNAWKEDPLAKGNPDFNKAQVRRAQARVDKLQAQTKKPAKGKSRGMPPAAKARGKAVAKKKAKKKITEKGRMKRKYRYEEEDMQDYLRSDEMQGKYPMTPYGMR